MAFGRRSGMERRRIFHDARELAAEIAEARSARGPVVLANGCFDVLHVGHVRYLRDAAACGGILVVAVNDDESARALKGEGRPVMPEEERAEVLAALRFVDYVLIFSGSTVDEVMRALRPDYHAKGTDYTLESVPERETARSIGCTTIIVGDPKDHSSRELIERIRAGGTRGS